ncbi:unnamed protein product [Agarophyton chilense]
MILTRAKLQEQRTTFLCTPITEKQRLLHRLPCVRGVECFSDAYLAPYASHSNRAFLMNALTPPIGFVNITADTPGKYVFGAGRFKPNLQFLRPKWFERRICSKRCDEVILGYVSILLITVLTEIVLNFLKSLVPDVCFFVNPSQKHDRRDWEEIADGVQTLLSYRFLNLWSRYRSGQKFRFRTVLMVVLALSIFLLDGSLIILTQPNQYPSEQYEYNLLGSHPIGADDGLGKFLRRNARERPCITPVFYESNPIRNYSLSTCHTFDLREAHQQAEDSVNYVKIGSWFHKGGSDHHISFGNASIKIKARAIIYGAEGGTWRLLFPILYNNHIRITHYLHQRVIGKILKDSCRAERSPRSCSELIVGHRIDLKLVTKEILLWVPRNRGINRKEHVRGLETTVRAGIKQPWETVFQSLGPLMTTELIQEVKGPSSYAHIATEEERQGIPGLLYLERRKVSAVLLLLCFPIAALVLCCVKLFWRKAYHSSDHSKSDLGVVSSDQVSLNNFSESVGSDKEATDPISSELHSVFCSQDDVTRKIEQETTSSLNSGG